MKKKKSLPIPAIADEKKKKMNQKNTLSEIWLEIQILALKKGRETKVYMHSLWKYPFLAFTFIPL